MEMPRMGLQHRHGIVNTANYRCLCWLWSLVLLFCGGSLSAMIQAGGFKPKVPTSQDFHLNHRPSAHHGPAHSQWPKKQILSWTLQGKFSGKVELHGWP